MTATFAFLRAINLGKNRQFPAADIRRVTESLGFTDVRTHAASGNLLFTTDSTVHQGGTRHDVETLLEAAFSADRGFEVPTITFTTEQFLVVRDDAFDLATMEPPIERHYVYLLKEELGDASVAAVEARSNDRGRMVVRGRGVHALLYPGYVAGVVDPLGGARLLGTATSRNVSVIHLLADRWGRA